MRSNKIQGYYAGSKCHAGLTAHGWIEKMENAGKVMQVKRSRPELDKKKKENADKITRRCQSLVNTL